MASFQNPLPSRVLSLMSYCYKVTCLLASSKHSSSLYMDMIQCLKQLVYIYSLLLSPSLIQLRHRLSSSPLHL